jgi:hypothetical protein
MAMKTDTTNTTPTPASILAAAIKRHKDQRAKEQHRSVLHGAFMRMPEVKRAFTLLTRAMPEHNPWPWLSVGTYSPTVDVGVSTRDLASFKDPALLRLLSQFAGDEWTPETTDYTYDVPNRDYRFKREIHNPLSALRLTAAERRSLAWLEEHDRWYIPKVCTLTVAVYAYVKADSDACRIEVVGVEEEVIKKEVKRIVCA